MECEVQVDRIHIEQLSEFKYLGCVMDVSGTDKAECSRKVAGAISSLFNARDMQLEYVRVLH